MLTIYGVALALVIGFEHVAARRIQTVLTTLVILAFVTLVLRQGHLRLASQITVIGVGFTLALSGFQNRGVLGIGFAGYTVLTVTASLLLGMRVGLLTALAASITGGVMLYFQTNHASHDEWLNLFSSWAGESTLFFLCAGIVGFSSMKMRAAFNSTKEEVIQRKAAETGYREAETRLNLALQAARMGLWEWDIASGKVTWSPVTEDLFRIPRGSFTQTYEAFLALIHPEDRDALKQSITLALGPPGSFSVQHRVLAIGQTLWMECHGMLLRSSSGQPERMVGTVVDITHREAAALVIEQSEKRFRHLVDHVHVGILVQGPESEILSVNPAALDLLGLTNSQILGKTSFDPSWNVVHEDGTDFPSPDHPVPRAIREKKAVKNVVMGVFRPARQDRAWLLVNAIPEISADGSVVQVLCTFTDISAIKTAETALRDNERQYRGFIELSPDGVVVHQEGVLVYANRAMARILGAHGPADLIGRRVLDLVAPEMQQEVKDRIQGILSEGKIAPLREEKLVRLDGGLIDVEASGAPHTWRNKPAVLVVVRDITDRKKAEARAKENELLYKSIFDAAGDGLFLADRTPRYVDVNQAGLDMLGYTKEELLRLGPADVVAKEDLEKNPIRTKDMFEQPGVVVRRRLRRKDGTLIDAEINARPITAGLTLGIAREMGARLAAEIALRDSEEKWKLIAENVPAFILLVDRQGKILFINHVFPGWKREEIIGKPIADFMPPEEQTHTPIRLADVFERGLEIEYEQAASGSPGEERHYASRIVPIRHEGAITAALLVATDITARKKDVARLEHQASHDSLTDLPNRQFLIESALEAIGRAEKEGRQLALLLMDLDRFKEINDTLGHFTGDLLLKRIGPRMESYLKSIGAEMARLGGDEFGILLPRIDEPAEAEGIAQTLHHLLREPFLLEGMNLEIDCSIGVAVYPFHGQDPISLLRCADVAMYLAKKKSVGVAMYAPDQDRYSRRRLALLTELGLAIRESQLTLHYQPKYSLHDRKLVGVEALVRWHHPVHGMVSPGEFVPLAETGNLIIPLTNWVFEEASRQWRVWKNAGHTVKIAVNLSVRNLMDEQYPLTVDAILKKHKVERSCFELEITESAIMADPERALSVLNRLHSLGVDLSIDDFGTGYSSLAYLSRLPIDALKIDLSFVRQMMESERNMVIVNSTVRLAHTLGLIVIAEGVEDERTLNTLSDMKCDMAQGFFFSPPRRAEDLTEIIARDL